MSRVFVALFVLAVAAGACAQPLAQELKPQEEATWAAGERAREALDLVFACDEVKPKQGEDFLWTARVRAFPAFGTEWQLYIKKSIDDRVAAWIWTIEGDPVTQQLARLRNEHPGKEFLEIVKQLHVKHAPVNGSTCPAVEVAAKKLETLEVSALPPNVLVVDGTWYLFDFDTQWGSPEDFQTKVTEHPLVKWAENALDRFTTCANHAP